MSVFKRSHLRLVSCNGGARATESEIHSDETAVTLQNPDFPDHCILSVLLFREEDVLRNDAFMGFLKASGTRCLFDVRSAPRLDFIAPNRISAFRALSESGIDYVDLLGRLRTNEDCAGMPESWSDLIHEKLKDRQSEGSAIAFIFDDANVLRRAEYVLPRILKDSLEFTKVRVEMNAASSDELIAL